jgi:hypothetical protein
MLGSSSRYGGNAAVFVFGIGLLATGKRWAGVGILVFGVLAITTALLNSGSVKVLLVAIGAFLLSGVLGYKAASNEVNGTATYHTSLGLRGDRTEHGTREVSPDKFREATNFLWELQSCKPLG